MNHRNTSICIHNCVTLPPSTLPCVYRTAMTEETVYMTSSTLIEGEITEHFLYSAGTKGELLLLLPALQSTGDGCEDTIARRLNGSPHSSREHRPTCKHMSSSQHKHLSTTKPEFCAYNRQTTK